MSHTSQFPIPTPAIVSPEDIIIRHSVGTATISQDSKSISIHSQMFDAGNVRDGKWSGVFDLVTPLTKADRKRKPAPPPFNHPVAPVPEPDPDAFGKAEWTFGEGSILYGLGQALIVAATYQNNLGNLWISGNLLLTEGSTGRFTGSQGTMTCAISMLVPENTKLSELGGKTLDVKSIDVFRVTLGEYIAGKAPTAAG